MHEFAARVALVALAVGNGVTGAWARFAPRDFFHDFPGGSHLWVEPDGPYNEHLLTDFGAGLLAVAVVCLVGAWRPTREVVVAAALANIVLGALHFAYHWGTRDLFSTRDNVLSLSSIGLGVVLGVGLLALTRGLDQSKSSERSLRSNS
jgi:hypothetical protein